MDKTFDISTLKFNLRQVGGNTMKSFIESLYYGEINPCEKPAPKTERYTKNRELICRTEEKLTEKFPSCTKLLNTLHRRSPH